MTVGRTRELKWSERVPDPPDLRGPLVLAIVPEAGVLVIASEIPAGTRRARIWAADVRALPSGPPAGDDWFWDDEDREREPLLRAALARPVVRAVAYPTVGAEDVLQVFLGHDGELIFACVVESEERLSADLAQRPTIVEGFSLQVAPLRRLTVDGVRAALQSWRERNFPDIGAPAFVLELWTDPRGIRRDLLDVLAALAPVTVSEPVPGEIEPDPALADPPFEDAA